MKKMTDEELKQVAVDLYDGKIFSNCHFRSPEEILSLLGSVFMAFSLSKDPSLPSKNIAFIYEYLDKAGPLSINGYPMFMSCRYLCVDDTKKMFKFYDGYKKVKGHFLSGKK